MTRLNLNQLRTLHTLLEERNLTKAAERLLLTQSAISKQLGQLRDYFGDPLLIREGNLYWLSAKAEQLLPKVQHILAEIDSLNDASQFDPKACKRQFRFACTDYVAQFIFPKIVQRLARDAPDIDIAYEMMKPEWMPYLNKRHLDFVAMVNLPVPDNVQSVPLGEDGSVCMMAKNHPLAHLEQPSVEQLLAYPFAVITSGGDKSSFFDRYVETQGHMRRIFIQVPFYLPAFEIVADTDTLLIVPEHIARTAQKTYETTHCAFPFASPVNHYQLCWHVMHDKDKAHAWLRALIATEIEQSIYFAKGMNSAHT